MVVQAGYEGIDHCRRKLHNRLKRVEYLFCLHYHVIYHKKHFIVSKISHCKRTTEILLKKRKLTMVTSEPLRTILLGGNFKNHNFNTVVFFRWNELGSQSEVICLSICLFSNIKVNNNHIILISNYHFLLWKYMLKIFY